MRILMRKLSSVFRADPRGVAILVLVGLVAGCGRSSAPSARASRRQPSESQRIVLVDPRDTAAYAEAGPEAIAAVARCQLPACRPDIHRGPAPGELTVGLDSTPGRPRADTSYSEYQWHVVPHSLPPGGEAHQDSAWAATLTGWETARPRRLLLVDGTPRTFAYARDHVSLSSVSGIQEVSAKEARALSSEPDAANGAIVITTKAHAPAPPR